jgi:hypothetical protein
MDPGLDEKLKRATEVMRKAGASRISRIIRKVRVSEGLRPQFVIVK